MAEIKDKFVSTILLEDLAVAPRTCPWCGSLPAVLKLDVPDNDHPDHKENFKVQCNNASCPVLVKTFFHDSPEKAVAVWNNRLESGAQPMVREKIHDTMAAPTGD